MSRKLSLLFTLVVVISLLVTACATPTAAPTVAPTKAPAAPTTAPAAPTAAPTKAPVPPTAVPATADARAHHLHLRRHRASRSVSIPAIITDGISGRVTNQIFEGLVKYDKDTTNVVASLAEKWESSADGKTWTFTLRKGVKFHDGTDFNADAVLKNFDYWANTKNALHDAQIKAGQTFEYYEAQFGGFDDDSIITKVEAVDASTVKFTLKEAQGPFLQNLGMFVFAFWSPTALQKAGVDSCKKPVGTGPFKFVEWKPNESVTLAKNADYWDKANAGQGGPRGHPRHQGQLASAWPPSRPARSTAWKA